MAFSLIQALTVVGLAQYVSAAAQPSCSTTLSASYAAPSINSVYQYRLVAKGLSTPRAIQFDSAGNLLVVARGQGIIALTGLNKTGNCLLANSPKVVVSSGDLNHGLALSKDGKTLYASSSDKLYSWSYDAKTQKVTSGNKTLISGMYNSDHDTRTLLRPNFVDGLLLINRGSSSNIDSDSGSLSSGHGQIKAFNVTNTTKTLTWNSDGRLIAWGIRNAVGLGEQPTSGGIYSVENSVDQLTRSGQDVHEDNPAERMNFHGFLAKPNASIQGHNYGYPNCVAAWRPDLLPSNSGLNVGTLFSFDNSGATDSQCQKERLGPRIVFQAHSAPLDIKFNPKGTAAWVSFHGSWDRTNPTGYKLVALKFTSGRPLSSLANSHTAYMDIMTNPDNSKCPGSCFRPVGLAFDGQGRLFMSSDQTGEIYMITRADGQPTSNDLPSGPVASQDSSGMTISKVSSKTSGGAGSIATMVPGMVGLGVGAAMLGGALG